MSLHTPRQPRRLIVKRSPGTELITGLRVPENARMIGNQAVDHGWHAIGTWAKEKSGALFFRLHIMTPEDHPEPLTVLMHWYVKGDGGEGWKLETRAFKDKTGTWREFRYLTDLEKTMISGEQLRLAPVTAKH